MAQDPTVNFGKVVVSTGYADDATEVALESGHGAKLPLPSEDGQFNVVWFNSSDYSDPSDDPNVEIVRVTARSTDTLTITRAQEGTTASNKNTEGKTYKMILAPTRKTIEDIQAELDEKYEEGDTPTFAGATFTETINPQQNIFFIPTDDETVATTRSLAHRPIYRTDGDRTTTASIQLKRTSTSNNTYDGEIVLNTRATGSVLTAAMTLTKDQDVGIGTSTPQSALHVVRSGATGQIVADTYHSTPAALIALRGSRGSSDTPAAIQSGDVVAQYGMLGGHGDASFGSAIIRIKGVAEQNFTSSAKGTALVLETTNQGASSATEKLRITSAGDVLISPGNILLDNAARINFKGTSGGDTDYGIRVNSSNEMKFRVAAGDRLTLDGSGDLTATGNVKGSRLWYSDRIITAFTIAIANNSGTIQHRFGSMAGPGNTNFMMAAINDASTDWTNTPTVSSTAGFGGAAAGALDGNEWILIFDTDQQGSSGLMGWIATIEGNNTGNVYYVRAFGTSRNIDGTTVFRPEWRLTDVDGATVSWLDLATGKSIIVGFFGFVRDI